MKNTIIWEKMVIEDMKIITSEQIDTLAKRIGKNGEDIRDYLLKEGYIVRIFKGIFYVLSYDERRRSFPKKSVFYHEMSIYDIVRMALEAKGVKKWYFGLETALKMNLMTHEYFTMDFVITDSFRTTQPIDIIGYKYKFFQWSKWHFQQGIIKRKGLPFSDKEKTVLDLIYQSHRKGANLDFTLGPYREYHNKIDILKFKKYLLNYPERFQRRIEEYL